MDIIASLAAVAVAYALFAIFIQRKLGNPRKSVRTQMLMNEKMKEIKEIANTDKALFIEKQKEVSKMMTDNMKNQFKPILITFPLFLGLFYLVLPDAFTGFLGTKTMITIMSIGLTYSQFFIAITFVIGLVVTMIFTSMDRKAVKRELDAEQAMQSNNNVSQS